VTPLQRYERGWRHGAIGAGLDPEDVDDIAYARGYRHGVAAHQHAMDSFLAAPDRDSSGGHAVPPPSVWSVSDKVRALYP